jgi:hypothetical protein
MKTPLEYLVHLIENNISELNNHLGKKAIDNFIIQQNQMIMNWAKELTKIEKTIIEDAYNSGENYGYSIAMFQIKNNVVMDENSFMLGSEYFKQTFTENENKNEKEREIKTDKQ